jgi:curved DNA-binding protein CbpA
MDFSDQNLESVISIPLLIESGVRGMKYHPAIKQFMEKKIPFRKQKGHSYLLTKEEKDVLTLIDRRSTFEEILNATAYSPEQFWKSQYLFYCLDLIGIVGEEIEKEEKVEKPVVTPPKKKKAKKVEKTKVIPVKKVKAKKVERAKEVAVEKEKEKKKEIPKEPPMGKIVEKPEPPPAKMAKEEKVEKSEKPPAVKKEEKAKKPEEPPTDKDKERLDEVKAQAEQLSGLDYYEILKVSKSASESDIKRSYFDMARKYHPDSFERELDQESRKMIEDVFAYVTKAYQTLINKEKREEYDSASEAPEEEEDLSRKAEIKFRQGKTLFNMKRYEDAVILLEEAVRLSSSKGRFYLLLALTESKIPTFRRKAEQDFLKAIELESFNPEGYVGLGLFYKDEGFKTRAKKQFRRALEIDPEHNVALRELEELSEGEEKKGKGLLSFIKKKKGR